METLVFEITEKSKIPFLLELLSHFDFVRNVKINKQIELLEEEGLMRAMKVAEEENDYLNTEDALKFLDND